MFIVFKTEHNEIVAAGINNWYIQSDGRLYINFKESVVEYLNEGKLDLGEVDYIERENGVMVCRHTNYVCGGPNLKLEILEMSPDIRKYLT